jgi:DNA helicase-2/ATP-dependent DNA helicase PcrA
LNPQQRLAVETTKGPLLVLAGPGSGKTRVLTHRIAYLIRQQNVDPWNIIAVTFTNKAAKEMRHRLNTLIGEAGRDVMMGTFHAICARILRRHIQHIGYDNSFLIYDTDDQRRLVKQVIAEMNLNEKTYRPTAMHAGISKAKNEGLTPKTYRAESYWEEMVGRIYAQYQERLETNNALDFDDLLLLTVRLFKEMPNVLDAYRRRWQYIHVDEFQDTNLVQYELVRLLGETHRNVFVVGDIDQCLPVGSHVQTSQGEVPIEQVRVGDTVVAGAGRGTTAPGTVQKVHARPYRGVLIQATLRSGRVLRATPNHMCFARPGVRADVHYVYLMYRQDKGYRIGLCVGARSQSADSPFVTGLQVRVNQEHADKVWILRVCPTREEATYYEQFYAFEYGIPTTVFHIVGRGLQLSQEAIDDLYTRIDTHSRATTLMTDLGLYADYPHYRAGSTDRGTVQRMVVHLTAFGGNSPSLQSPWFRHRIWLNASDRATEQQVALAGLSTRPGRRNTWRMESCYKELGRSLELAEQLAEVAGGADIAQWARFSKGAKFALLPAAHLRPTMIVPAWQDGQIVDEEIVAVEEVDYSGTVYDLDIEHLHNFIAEGVVVHNSIYKFRGADYRNVLKFEETFPEGKTIALEQNYRSTQNILDAASSLIRRNRNRKDKGLWSERGSGTPIIVFEAYDESEEAQYIVREVQRLKARENYSSRDFAVMYRMNAQSRALEEAFVRSNVKYVIVGGTRFYERREVKDILAYLRLLHNPYDSVSLERIINVPTRGIGDKTYQELVQWAARLGIPAFSALQLLDEKVEDDAGSVSPFLPNVPPPFATRSRQALLDFHRTMQPIIKGIEAFSLPTLIGEIVERTGYQGYLRDGTTEGEERWANVLELQTVASQYEHLETKPALAEFLENAALVSDADSVPEEELDAVTLMTLHTAKGLEYPVVFLPGVEENMLPHSRALEDPEELEEERRLAYVGITRAKDRLYLIHTFRRSVFGRSAVSEPSRFLRELPREVLEQSKERSKRPATQSEWTDDDTWARATPARRKKGQSDSPSSAWTTRPAPAKADRTPSKKEGGKTQFKAGDRVRHEKFGDGVVINSTPSGGDEEVVVAFPGDKPKKLLASFARLKKL